MGDFIVESEERELLEQAFIRLGFPRNLWKTMRMLAGEEEDVDTVWAEEYNVYVYKVLPCPPGSKVPRID